MLAAQQAQAQSSLPQTSTASEVESKQGPQSAPADVKAQGAKTEANTSLVLNQATASSNTGSAVAGLQLAIRGQAAQKGGLYPSSLTATGAPSREVSGESQVVNPKARGQAEAAREASSDAIAGALSLKGELAGARIKAPKPSAVGSPAQEGWQGVNPASLVSQKGAVVEDIQTSKFRGMDGVVQDIRPKKPMENALSGSEFLSTLGAARGSQVSGETLRGQSGDASQGGESGTPFGKQSKGSLRVIDGGAKGKKLQFGEELLASRELAPLGTQAGLAGTGWAKPLPTEVTGHVTKGANAEDRLSSQALSNAVTGMRNLSAQGGGEMRIRLKPENLGELHVRVMTDGRNVGLQIQASSDHAKRILEESMSHLKEGMAVQNLSLTTVDMTVAQLGGGAEARHESTSQGQHSQAGMQDMMGNPGSMHQGSGQAGRDSWSGVGHDSSLSSGRMRAASAVSSASAHSGASRSGAAANGRLDVRA